MIMQSYTLYKTIKFSGSSYRIPTKSFNLKFDPTHILCLKDTNKDLDFLIVSNSSKISDFQIPCEFNLIKVLESSEILLDYKERLKIPKEFKDLILKPSDEFVGLFKYSNHLRLYNGRDTKYFL